MVILMYGKDPEGGKWNYDAENRGSFNKAGPKDVPQAKRCRPDATTKAVMKLVERRFNDDAGQLERIDWQVTSKQVHQTLGDFVTHRLADFGQYQDAMWSRRL